MSRIEETLQKATLGEVPLETSVQDSRQETESIKELSALQDLSFKIELCLKKQHRVQFITKEISEIIKKSY